VPRTQQPEEINENQEPLQHPTSSKLHYNVLERPYSKKYTRPLCNRDTSVLRTVQLVPEIRKTFLLRTVSLNRTEQLCNVSTWVCSFGVLLKEIRLYSNQYDNLKKFSFISEQFDRTSTRAIRNVIGYLHGDVMLLLRPESFRVLLSSSSCKPRWDHQI